MLKGFFCTPQLTCICECKYSLEPRLMLHSVACGAQMVLAAAPALICLLQLAKPMERVSQAGATCVAEQVG